MRYRSDCPARNAAALFRFDDRTVAHCEVFLKQFVPFTVGRDEFPPLLRCKDCGRVSGRYNHAHVVQVCCAKKAVDLRGRENCTAGLVLLNNRREKAVR